MEKLTICCKTLYDNDMINKQNELDTYKKTNLQPVIYFDTTEEFEKRKQELFTELENEIKNKWDNYDLDTLAQETCRGPRLVSDFEQDLYYILIKVLQNLKFNHTDWLEKKIYSICSKLTITLHNMIWVCFGEDREYLTEFEEDANHCSKLIYNIVIDLLEDEFFKDEIYDAGDRNNDYRSVPPHGRFRMWQNFKENNIFKIRE